MEKPGKMSLFKEEVAYRDSGERDIVRDVDKTALEVSWQEPTGSWLW